MKKLIIIAFVILNLKTFGQDMIYFSNGNSVPGRITEIKKDSVKFKNLAYGVWPVFSYPVANIQFAFNNTGNYLIFNPLKSFTDKEKGEFIEANAKYRPFDIIVDLNGKLSTLTIASETESEISDGKVNLNKDSLAFVIRKNGNHELFCAVDKAFLYLEKNKLKVDSLLASLSIALPVPIKSDAGFVRDTIGYAVPDTKRIGLQASENVQELEGYFNTIISANHDSISAKKDIEYACRLFLNSGEDSQVEVSSTKTTATKTYKLRDYLYRLKKERGKFIKVTVTYADINYETKYRKVPDGNYYGVVVFSQQMKGFNNYNFIYSRRTKRNLVFKLPFYGDKILYGRGPYPNEEHTALWQIYFNNVVVVETEKL